MHHLLEMPTTSQPLNLSTHSAGIHVEELGNINGTSMVSCAFIGCIFTLEIMYAFVIIQMAGLLDNLANTATHLISGASVGI